MVRLVLALALVTTACTSAQAPIARRTGMVASIGGVVGLTAAAAASGIADTEELVVGFSIISAIGIGLYAAGELTDPTVQEREETTQEKHSRWARILTERAFRYAREGNCRRVRRVEKRVNFYDREIHDFVFMRDAEIARCMSEPERPAPPPEEPADEATAGEPPVDPSVDPSVPPPVLPPPASVRDPAAP